MTVFNVLTAVVANFEANSKTDAIIRLNRALSDAGFEPYTPGEDAVQIPHAFESEPDTVVFDLPRVASLAALKEMAEPTSDDMDNDDVRDRYTAIRNTLMNLDTASWSRHRHHHPNES